MGERRGQLCSWKQQPGQPVSGRGLQLTVRRNLLLIAPSSATSRTATNCATSTTTLAALVTPGGCSTRFVLEGTVRKSGWVEECIPDHMWQRDTNVYTAVEDQLGHAVEDWMIAPLRAYGSLRQLQDVSKALAGAHFNEDFTEMNTKRDSSRVFKSARLQRQRWNPLKFYSERICDPEYHMSIEEVAGNAPHWETTIRDTSRSTLFNSDMVVPASMRESTSKARTTTPTCVRRARRAT